jgi:hypothetical protein
MLISFYYLLLFVLVCWGFTLVLTKGRIFDSLRPNKEFFYCPMCIGFWVGLLMGVVFLFFDILLFPNVFLSLLIGCFISSAISYFLCSILDDDGFSIKRKIIFLTPKEEKKRILNG